MKRAECPQQDTVLKAVRSDQWEESLRSHLDQCISCEEVVRTAQWMQDLAGSDEGESTLPNSELVWLKAQISREQAQRERAFRSWGLVVMSVQGLVATLVAVGLYWNWSIVQSLLNGLAVGLSSVSETLVSYPGSVVLGSLILAGFSVLLSWAVTPDLDEG